DERPRPTLPGARDRPVAEWGVVRRAGAPARRRPRPSRADRDRAADRRRLRGGVGRAAVPLLAGRQPVRFGQGQECLTCPRVVRRIAARWRDGGGAGGRTTTSTTRWCCSAVTPRTR